MANFYIQKLIITGSGKETAVVDFVDGLNIVYGPSDTGKSYIVECIDYMLGSDKIRFDTNTGYDTFQLNIATKNGLVTLRRTVGKNNFSVTSQNPDIESGEYTAKWNAQSKKDDISDVWLRLMGIRDNHKIIKNVRRESQRLTVRTFAHMLLIKEIPVYQESSIITPVQNTAVTAAFSALYFLITGEDFSDSTPKEEKKIREARKKAVISYINAQLSEFAKKKTALTKLPSVNVVDLQAQVEQIIDELAETERQITLATGRSKSLLSEIYTLSEELAECNNLYNRYQALRTQYSADIQRLTFIVDGEIHHHEMGENSMCPFCDGKINPRKEKSYIEASKAELAKIRLQLEDLRLAESDLVGWRVELEQQIAVLNAEKSGVENLISTQLRPKSEELKQSLKEYRYAIEINKESSMIGDFETTLKQDLFDKMIEEEENDNDFKIKSYFDGSIFKMLNQYLTNILEACNYVDMSSAYVSPSSFDVVVNGQAKELRGKGYRAFLNTIFAISLMEYLSAEGKYPPSLLLVDSPILSLKEGVDDQAPDTMKAGLFKYLLGNHGSGQIIIIENEIPPSLDYSNAHVIEFTKGKKPGRYGLLSGVKS